MRLFNPLNNPLLKYNNKGVICIHRIKEEFVRQLYQLKQKEKRPITHLANEAIEQYLKSKSLIKRGESNDRRT